MRGVAVRPLRACRRRSSACSRQAQQLVVSAWPPCEQRLRLCDGNARRRWQAPQRRRARTNSWWSSARRDVASLYLCRHEILADDCFRAAHEPGGLGGRQEIDGCHLEPPVSSQRLRAGNMDGGPTPIRQVRALNGARPLDRRPSRNTKLLPHPRAERGRPRSSQDAVGHGSEPHRGRGRPRSQRPDRTHDR